MDGMDLAVIEKIRTVESQVRLAEHLFAGKTENLEGKAKVLQEKIINLYEWKSQIETQQKDALESVQKTVGIQNEDIKKAQTSLISFEENVKHLKTEVK